MIFILTCLKFHLRLETLSLCLVSKKKVFNQQIDASILGHCLAYRLSIEIERFEVGTINGDRERCHSRVIREEWSVIDIGRV